MRTRRCRCARRSASAHATGAVWSCSREHEQRRRRDSRELAASTTLHELDELAERRERDPRAVARVAPLHLAGRERRSRRAWAAPRRRSERPRAAISRDTARLRPVEPQRRRERRRSPRSSAPAARQVEREQAAERLPDDRDALARRARSASSASSTPIGPVVPASVRVEVLDASCRGPARRSAVDGEAARARAARRGAASRTACR